MKVLISNKLDKMFPEWLRFVKGVVDSEDIPRKKQLFSPYPPLTIARV